MPPDGFPTSSQTDLFQPAPSISAASSISRPLTLPAQGSGISSRASPAGDLPAASPASRTTSTSGPDHVRVSRFRSRDANAAMPTNDTSGPLFSASSPSAVLQSSLESRLRALLDVNGSPEFVLTWKAQDMPAGPPICRLRASARRTSGSGCSGAVSGWGAPKASDERGGMPERFGGAQSLNGRRSNLNDAMAAAWATPTARDWRSGEASEATHARNARPLNEQMVAAAWPTPKESDHRPGMPERHAGAQSLNGRRSNLNDALTAATVRTGPTPSGSPATTARRGVPNPAFPCWLQGYPAEWLWNAPAPKRGRSRASPPGADSETP